MIKDAISLWNTSAVVWEGRSGFDGLLQRIRFLAKALSAYRCVKPFLQASPNNAIGQIMISRPETIGAVIWPYQCAAWDARTRLARIREHYSLVESVGGPIDFPIDGRFLLVDLSEICERLSVIIDQPKWFMREGGLCINLFLGSERIFSLAFSLSKQDGEVSALIGAIQGRDIEGVLDAYREITKAAHGMRPRDLLIELFRMFCSIIEVSKIFAVADEYRHHRHPYFGNVRRNFPNDYNEIWSDRGGIRVNSMLFELAVDSPRRALDAIPAKKRGMYRKRYAMLNTVRHQMLTTIVNEHAVSMAAHVLDTASNDTPLTTSTYRYAPGCAEVTSACV